MWQQLCCHPNSRPECADSDEAAHRRIAVEQGGHKHLPTDAAAEATHQRQANKRCATSRLTMMHCTDPDRVLLASNIWDLRPSKPTSCPQLASQLDEGRRLVCCATLVVQRPEMATSCVPCLQWENQMLHLRWTKQCLPGQLARQHQRRMLGKRYALQHATATRHAKSAKWNKMHEHRQGLGMLQLDVIRAEEAKLVDRYGPSGRLQKRKVVLDLLQSNRSIPGFLSYCNLKGVLFTVRILALPDRPEKSEKIVRGRIYTAKM